MVLKRELFTRSYLRPVRKNTESVKQPAPAKCNTERIFTFLVNSKPKKKKKKFPSTFLFHIDDEPPNQFPFVNLSAPHKLLSHQGGCGWWLLPLETIVDEIAFATKAPGCSEQSIFSLLATVSLSHPMCMGASPPLLCCHVCHDSPLTFYLFIFLKMAHASCR